MGDLLRSPRDRVSYLAYPNLFGTKGFVKVKVKVKICVFLWQLIRKRLLSNDNIARRRGPSTGLCALCGEFEDTNHIFSHVP